MPVFGALIFCTVVLLVFEILHSTNVLPGVDLCLGLWRESQHTTQQTHRH